MARATESQEQPLVDPGAGNRKMEGFGRPLTVLVFLCMVAGTALGRVAPGFARSPSL